MEEQERAALVARLRGWLASSEPLLARHGALLLAEVGQLSPDSLLPLLSCLQASDDLVRYRAQAALNQQRDASALGRATIEAMERQAASQSDVFSLASTFFDWSLKDVRHDVPEWLREWAEAGEASFWGVCTV